MPKPLSVLKSGHAGYLSTKQARSEGSPTVTGIISLNRVEEASLLRVAAAVEKPASAGYGCSPRRSPAQGDHDTTVSDFNAPSREGVSGDVEGQRVVIGNELAMRKQYRY